MISGHGWRLLVRRPRSRLPPATLGLIGANVTDLQLDRTDRAPVARPSAEDRLMIRGHDDDSQRSELRILTS